MLTGRLPYGTRVPGARSRAEQRRLTYASALSDDRPIPAWVDRVLERAVAIDPARRHADIAEFVHELRHPSASTLAPQGRPLAERNPLRFWQAVALLSSLGCLLQALAHMGGLW